MESLRPVEVIQTDSVSKKGREGRTEGERERETEEGRKERRKEERKEVNFKTETINFQFLLL
jgi:hypothetical protein